MNYCIRRHNRLLVDAAALKEALSVADPLYARAVSSRLEHFHEETLRRR